MDKAWTSLLDFACQFSLGSTELLVNIVCILVPAEYLTDALAHHLYVSVMGDFLFAGIGNELPDLPGQRVMHVADQHKTTIERDVRRVETNTDFLVRNHFWKRKIILRPSLQQAKSCKRTMNKKIKFCARVTFLHNTAQNY